MGNQKIILKKSAVQGKVPLASDLEIGEVAINTYDAKLFTKHSDGSVKEVAPAETTTTQGAIINAATAKTTPADADMVGLMDSAASNLLKKLSWSNIKANLKTYFDSIYATGTIPAKATAAEVNTGTDDTKFITPSALRNSNQSKKYIELRLVDKATDLAAGTLVGGDFRIPRACTVVAVGAYVDTAGTGLLTIDINEGGTSILSTKLTIDANEKTSETAAAAPVVSDTAIAADAIVTIDIDSITGTAPKGLTVWLEVLM